MAAFFMSIFLLRTASSGAGECLLQEAKEFRGITTNDETASSLHFARRQ